MTTQRSEVIEMKLLRKTANKTRWDTIRNQNIREECNVGQTTDWQNERRRESVSHISRVDDSWMVKQQEMRIRLEEVLDGYYCLVISKVYSKQNKNKNKKSFLRKFKIINANKKCQNVTAISQSIAFRTSSPGEYRISHSRSRP